jgi:hypothetical protein
VAYDYVAPCWPPHYHVFDSVFQMVHVQVAQVRRGVICLGLDVALVVQLVQRQAAGTT